MKSLYTEPQKHEISHKLISNFIEPKSKVLDLGCESGDLLKRLKDEKNIHGIGVEINEQKVIKCIEKGLCVFQGDIDGGLNEYQSNSYDYVILNQTLQLTQRPEYVIKEMLRVGSKIIIGLPNFGYWKVRSQLFFSGKMPKSESLPFEWFDTPNIHLVTIKDFREFCNKREIEILKEVYLTKTKRQKCFLYNYIPNLLAEEAIFLLTKKLRS